MKHLSILLGLFALWHVTEAQICSVSGCPGSCSCCLTGPASNKTQIRCPGSSMASINISFIPNPTTTHRLEVVDSSFMSMPSGLCRFWNVRELTLRNNKIQTLPNNSISCLIMLEYLELSFNDISVLLDHTFGPIGGTLRYIDLSSNTISTIGSSVFTTDMSVLQNVRLDGNLLTSVEPWPLTLLSLQEVDFSFNMITQVSYSVTKMGIASMNFAGGTVNPRILLDNNRFSGYNLSLFYFYGITNVSQLTSMNTFLIDYQSNPFNCDCYSQPVATEITNLYNTYSLAGSLADASLYSGLTCSFPSSLNGHKMMSLRPFDYLCPITAGCHIACGCGYAPSNQKVYMNCTGRGLHSFPLTAPNGSLVLSMAGNGLTSIPNVTYLSRSTEVYFQNNKIKVISMKNIADIKNASVISLNGNQIANFPRGLEGTSFPNLRYLSLHDNPLDCNCDNIWFLKWLQIYKEQLGNEGTLTCSDGTEIDVNKSDAITLWCGMQPIHFLAIGLALVGVVLGASGCAFMKPSLGQSVEPASQSGDMTPRFGSTANMNSVSYHPNYQSLMSQGYNFSMSTSGAGQSSMPGINI